MKSVAYIALVILSFLTYSCKKDTVKVDPELNQGPETPKYADQFLGDYICLEIYSHPNHPDSTQHWSVDTISTNKKITINSEQDSSLTVIISDSIVLFRATYDAPNTFTCQSCNGPPNYVEFFNNDSIYVYTKTGVMTSRRYSGYKN
ncbi:MAG: hypothetical protein ACPGSO_01210 [Vicingaceae bacterium]